MLGELHVLFALDATWGLPYFPDYKLTFCYIEKSFEKWGSTYIRDSTCNREFSQNCRKDNDEDEDSYETDDARWTNSMYVCLSRQQS